MSVAGERPPPSRRIEGFRYVLAFAYGFLAFSAGGRSVYQLVVRFDDAPLAVSLSVVAALVYLVAAICMRRRGARIWRVAVAACSFELIGVLSVGTASVVSGDLLHRATVWSQYGRGYGFVPLVLPMLGLGWLLRRETRRDYGVGELG